MVGCNPKMVDYWADGRCIPSLPYAFRIESITKGGVSAATWLGTPQGRLLWARILANSEGKNGGGKKEADTSTKKGQR
jgi:hypothetical protein